MSYRKLVIESILVGLVFGGGLATGCLANKPTASILATFTPTPQPSETLLANPSPLSTPQPSATLTPNPSPTATLTPTALDPRTNLEPGLYVVYWSQKTLYIRTFA